MAPDALAEGPESQFGPGGVDLHGRAVAVDHGSLAQRQGRRVGEGAGVGFPKQGLVAIALDSSSCAEQIEQVGHLLRSRTDHLHVAVRRRLERLEPAQRVGEAGRGRKRRAKVMARKRDELGKGRFDGHRVSGIRCDRHYSVHVTDLRDVFRLDLQASQPEVRLGLSRAGVTGISKAIRIRHGPAEKLIAADIECTVDLDPAQKGVHMSRFPELFEEVIEQVVLEEAFLVEELAAHIAREIVGRQGAGRAEARIFARYPVERKTPVTGLATQTMLGLIGIAAASQTGVRRVVGVEAAGINACPCAQGLVREKAGERLLGAGFSEQEVGRIFELVPLATHNQRGRGTLFVGTQSRVNAEQLGEIVESSMSAPVLELLKRPDELFIVEHAHLQPRFVEDSVRLALRGVLDAYPDLADEDFLFSRQVNLETIHTHDVVAERYGTVGELRAELAGGRPSNHTDLRTWIAAEPA